MNIKRIFIIDGAAGTGKSDLLEFVRNQIAGYNTAILKKYTTRKERREEKRTNKSLDLKFVSEVQFLKISNSGVFYQYKYPLHEGNHYGFLKSDLEKLIIEHDNIFVIIRSAATIKKIISDFSNCEIIPIFVYAIQTLIEERLRKEGYNDEEINFRIARSDEATSDLYTHPTLYKCVIINDSNKTVYQRQLKDHFDYIIKSSNEIIRIDAQTHFDLPSILQAYKPEMIKRLEKFHYDRNVFVMMKYREMNKQTFELIKVILERDGYNCVRADMNEWSITKDDIYNPYAVLYCCKYGIALFDEPEENYIYNTNVAIELALMHLQNKHCLMLKQKSLPSPPFDLASKIYREYEKESDLVSIISHWMKRL